MPNQSPVCRYVLWRPPDHQSAWMTGFEVGCAGRKIDYATQPWYTLEHRVTHHQGFIVGERVRREIGPRDSIPIIQAVSCVKGLQYALSALCSIGTPEERLKWQETALEKYELLRTLVDKIHAVSQEIEIMLARRLKAG